MILELSAIVPGCGRNISRCQARRFGVACSAPQTQKFESPHDTLMMFFFEWSRERQ